MLLWSLKRLQLSTGKQIAVEFGVSPATVSNASCSGSSARLDGQRRPARPEAIADRDYQRVVQAGSLGRVARLAHPTLEHFLPTLFSIGVANPKDELRLFNTSFGMTSISMRSIVLA
jgi:hypothetical protein